MISDGCGQVEKTESMSLASRTNTGIDEQQADDLKMIDNMQY